MDTAPDPAPLRDRPVQAGVELLEEGGAAPRAPEDPREAREARERLLELGRASPARRWSPWTARS